MPVLAVTGGVAAGKTRVAGRLAEALHAPSFSADAEVRRLLAGDREVAAEVAAALGAAVLGGDGFPDRERLRRRVFGNPVDRARLEAVLHPRVRGAWAGQAAHFRVAQRFLVVEIPLLYETGGEDLCDAVTVVACSHATQVDRMTRERDLDPGIAEQIIAAQLDPGEKMRRADHVIWNDGSEAALERQVDLLAGSFRARWAA